MPKLQGPMEWAVNQYRDSKKDKQYIEYEDYFDGKQDLRFATPRYASTFGNMFKAFAYNRCGNVVDSLADRLQIERFIQVGSNQEATVDEDLLEIWSRNNMKQRSGEVHKEALRNGDGYVLVWPESGEVLEDGRPLPVIWPQKARAIRVQYDDEKPGKIKLASKTWIRDDGRRRINLYFPERIEKYITTPGKSNTSALPLVEEGWEQFLTEGEEWPVENPFLQVPIFHFPNNAGVGEWGRSELTDIIPLQDALNLVLTNLLLAAELAGFPQKVILGLDANDPNVREGLARLEAGLNKIFTIPMGGSDGPQPSIQEFSAVNLVQLVSVVELFDKLISRASRVPIHYLQMSSEFPSGVALRVAETPFSAKIEDRQETFGNIWEEAMKLSLRQTGSYETISRISTIWTPSAIMQPEDVWNVAVLQNNVGIPLELIMKEAGYDDEQIKEAVRVRDEAMEAMDRALTGVGNDNPEDRNEGGEVGERKNAE